MKQHTKKISLLIITLSFFYSFFVKSVLAEEYTIVTTEMPPYVEGDRGLALDIVKELFNRANLNLVIKKMPLKRAVMVAERGLKKNPCVVPIQRSQERETRFKWIGPILITQSALFSLNEDEIKIDVFKDAFQYRILVSRGSADQDYLKGFGLSIDIANNEWQNMLKLQYKRARLLTADTIIAAYYAKKAGIKIKKQLNLITTLRALACHIDTPDSTIAQLNNKLQLMYRDGTIKKIFSNYMRELDISDSAQFLE